MSFTLTATMKNHVDDEVLAYMDFDIVPNPSTTPDSSGNVVRVGGQRVTTDENGTFTVSLASGGNLYYTVRRANGAVPFSEITFKANITDGTSVDLADVAPIPAPSPLASYVQGRGISSITDDDLDGVATITYTDGSTSSLPLSDTYVTKNQVGTTVETVTGAQAKATAAEQAAKAYAGTLAYGTDLEATDAVIDARTGSGKRPVGRDELMVNVRDHGATGDGVADDTAAIQAAVSAAATFGLEAFVPAGHYRVTTSIDLPDRAMVRLDPAATIDVTALPSLTPAFTASGTVAAAQSLTADAARGTKTLTLASTTGLAAGDWVKISSTRPWGSTSQPQGEIQRVESVTTTTLTVSEPLADTYATADSAAVAKMTMREDVTITGGRIHGNPGDAAHLSIGIHLDMVRGASVTGMKMQYVHYVGVFITDSVGVTVHDCHFNDSLGEGLGYAIAASWAAQDVSITACHSTRVRHLVSLGGGSARAGIARRVTVTGCTASQCFDSGLDCHPGAEDVTFVGNVISGSGSDGIVAQGGRFVISGNTINGSARHGILVQNQTVRGFDGAISGNNVHGSKGAGISIAVDATTEYRVWSGIAITGNVFTDGGSFGISIQNLDTTFKAEGFTLSGNVVRRHASHGIYLRRLKDITVGTNQVSDAASAVEGIYVQACADVAVSGNVIKGGARAYRVATSTGVTVTGNRGSGATVGLLTDTASAPVITMGNNFAGCTTPMSLGGTGNVASTADNGGAYNITA